MIENIGYHCLRFRLLPQMKIIGLPSANCGFTIKALPTELKAFTKWTPEKAIGRRSIND